MHHCNAEALYQLFLVWYYQQIRNLTEYSNDLSAAADILNEILRVWNVQNWVLRHNPVT